MSTAPAEAVIQPQPIIPPDMLEVPADDGDEPPHQSAEQTEQTAPQARGEEDPIFEEIRVGFEELRKMNHTELRQVISRRVELLENVLREREDRRAAIETARLASRMLDLRRKRALRIQRRVNIGSTLAAVASTFLLVAVMI